MTDNAKELLALAMDPIGLNAAVRECARITAPEIDDAEFERVKAENSPRYRNTVSDMERAIRAYLSARQQASVEEVARSLCKADGTAQCAAICLSHFSTSTTGGKCPEAALVWGHKCRALLAKYDIFEKVEG